LTYLREINGLSLIKSVCGEIMAISGTLLSMIGGGFVIDKAMEAIHRVRVAIKSLPWFLTGRLFIFEQSIYCSDTGRGNSLQTLSEGRSSGKVFNRL
jgi:hypothetical protein